MTTVRFGLAGAINYGASLAPRRRLLLPGFVLLVIHMAGLMALRRAATPAASAVSLADMETITYLDVPPPAETPSPRKIFRPRQVAVSEAVIIPAAAGGVAHADKVAGFQELMAPRELKALPPPDPSSRAVDERDFSGRGIVGGVAGGKPPPALPPDVAAAMAREGRLSDEATAPRAPPPAKPIAVEAVDIKPQLLNLDEISERMLAAYPPMLKNMGLEGNVIIQFVIDTTGAVVPGSGRVLRATHEQFGRAALDVLPHARFSRALMSQAGAMVAVPVTARIPLSWSQAQ